MARLFIGRRPAGGGAVKVMRDNADDPSTTPNTDYGKFLFNSEMQDIGYINEISKLQHDGSAYPNYGQYYYRPSGTGSNTFEFAVYRYTSELQYYYFSTLRYPGFNGIPGIFELRPRKSLGTKINGPISWGYDLDTYGSVRYVSKFLGEMRYSGALVKSDTWGGGGTISGGSGWLTRAVPTSGSHLETSNLVIWDLPATSMAVPWPRASAVDGQRNVRISPTTVRISRPGFDVDSASGRQFIINSDRIPAKIIRTGQISISAGSNVFVGSNGFTLTDTTYVDYLLSTNGSTWMFPCYADSITKSQTMEMRYAVSADGVRFYNDGNVNFTLRYMICADDAGTTTSGGSRTVRSGPDWFQIKRPGSSDSNPALNEIYLDTRMSFIQILAEGWLPESAFDSGPVGGGKSKRIDFDPKGLLPFVKMAAHRRGGSITTVPTYATIESNASGGVGITGPTGDSALARLGSNNVVFSIYPGKAVSASFNDNGQLVGSYNSDGDVIAIRYYILGIPQSI